MTMKALGQQNVNLDSDDSSSAEGSDDDSEERKEMPDELMDAMIH